MASNKKRNNILSTGIIFITAIIISGCTLRYHLNKTLTDETDQSTDKTEEIDETEEVDIKLTSGGLMTLLFLSLLFGSESANHPEIPSNEILRVEQVEIESSNLTNYFTINKEKLKLDKPRLQDGVHIFSFAFLITPKKNSNGKIYAFVYDEDRVKICSLDYKTISKDKPEGGYNKDCRFPVYFQGLGSDESGKIWQQNEVYRGFVTIPNPTRKIELIFEEQ